MHGYDVTDQSRFNPEIGDEASFLRLSEALQRHKMGLIADVVPNHMCITHPSNVWWWDVLENGPSSPFARYFDIDWHPPKEELVNKVLLPVLGDQYGRVLENQEIQIVYARRAISRFRLRNSAAARAAHLDHDPGAGRGQAAREAGRRSRACRRDGKHRYGLGHLPGHTETDDAKIRERQREKEIVKRRLSGLLEASAEAAEAIDAVAGRNQRRARRAPQLRSPGTAARERSLSS